MAEEPEVIEHEIEQTRHALAEKLEQIGEKISGTVESVSETVSGVTDTVTHVTEALEGTVQSVADTVSGTVESVKETVESVGERAHETVEAVKSAFNLPEHIRNHPWLWVGGSVAVGFVAGRVLLPAPTRHTNEASSFIRGDGYPQAASRSRGDGYERSFTSRVGETTSAAAGAAGSWLGSLMQQFAPELNRLKEVALGTLFGLARDTITRSVPESIKDQVQGIFNDVTEKVGGKPIEGSVMGEESESGGSSQHHGSSMAGNFNR